MLGYGSSAQRDPWADRSERLPHETSRAIKRVSGSGGWWKWHCTTCPALFFPAKSEDTYVSRRQRDKCSDVFAWNLYLQLCLERSSEWLCGTQSHLRKDI